MMALLAATGQPTGERQPREIEIALDGQTIRTLSIPVDQADVMQQIDLAGELTRGQHRLTIVERTDTAAGFQIAVRHFVDDGQSVAPSEEPLSVEIVYDRQRLQVDQTVTATATIANRSEQSAPMLILDLPIPGGFTIEPGELDELAGSQRIARYQITPRKAIVYLRDLPAGATLELRYRLRATMPVKVTAPPAEAYEYYDPDRRGRSQASRLEVVEA